LATEIVAKRRLGHADDPRSIRGETYASRYLSVNDYYAEGERIRGQWMGRRADLLELRGQVTLEQFDAVRQGLHPATGEFLRPRRTGDRFDINGERLNSARSLYDFTVSAAKSIVWKEPCG
jgi:hypothetical protein